MRAQGALAAVLLTLPVAAALVGTWVPPPAEFPDATAEVGLRFVAHKWTPDLGPPTSLLDLLPPGSPAVGDANRDGWPDLFFPSPQYTNATLNALRAPRSAFWLNDGSTLASARFEDATDATGLGVQGFAYAAAWGDADGDGWLDLFVGGYRLAKLFRNLGDGAFADVTAAWGLPQEGLVTSAAWGDADRDGDLDLALGHFSSWTEADGLVRPADAPGRANALLRNEGSAFTDATAVAGLDAAARRTTSLSWLDMDADGDLDLYATNYGEPAELWRNRGDGTFEERAAQAGLDASGHGACAAWEDVDQDSRLDALLGAGEGERDPLFLASGQGFVERGEAWGLGALDMAPDWGCALLDYDGDSDMDAVFARSGLEGGMARTPLLLMNEAYNAEAPALAFLDVTAEAGDDLARSAQGNLSVPGAFSGLAVLDHNLDGYPDVALVPGDGSPARLFVNLGHIAWGSGGGHWLKVALDGSGANRFGLGAQVTVKAGNVSVARTLGAGGSWGGGQAVATLDFGLLREAEGGYKGQAMPVSVRVAWPSGHVDAWEQAFKVRSAPRLTEGGAVQLDTLAPDVRLGLAGTPGARGWFTSASVSVTPMPRERVTSGTPSSGLKSSACSVEGAPWGPCVPVTVQGDGVHVLRAMAEDHAGNRAWYVRSVRIDTQAPDAGVASPPASSISAQGRVLAAAPQPMPPPLDAALVVAPVPLDARSLGAAGVALHGLLGSDGSQEVVASAADDTSGVHRVSFRLRNATGAVVAAHAPVFAPWTWAWPASAHAAGSYTLEVEVEDVAGHSNLGKRRVLLAATDPDALQQPPSVAPLVVATSFPLPAARATPLPP